MLALYSLWKLKRVVHLACGINSQAVLHVVGGTVTCAFGLYAYIERSESYIHANREKGSNAPEDALDHIESMHGKHSLNA